MDELLSLFRRESHWKFDVGAQDELWVCVSAQLLIVCVNPINAQVTMRQPQSKSALENRRTSVTWPVQQFRLLRYRPLPAVSEANRLRLRFSSSAANSPSSIVTYSIKGDCTATAENNTHTQNNTLEWISRWQKEKKNSHYCNIPELVQCHLFGWWPVFHVLWAFTHFISVKDIFIRVQYKQHIYI